MTLPHPLLSFLAARPTARREHGDGLTLQHSLTPLLSNHRGESPAQIPRNGAQPAVAAVASPWSLSGPLWRQRHATGPGSSGWLPPSPHDLIRRLAYGLVNVHGRIRSHASATAQRCTGSGCCYGCIHASRAASACRDGATTNCSRGCEHKIRALLLFVVTSVYCRVSQFRQVLQGTKLVQYF